MTLKRLRHPDSDVEVRGPAWRPWPVLVVLLSLPLRLGVSLGLLQLLLGGLDLTLQRQAGGLAQVPLAVE